MQIGFIGLGKMGLNMVKRLVGGGHQVVAFDRAPEAVQQAEAAGARGASSLESLVEALTPPRAVWVMVPSGAPTESTVSALASLLSRDDIIIDGGNTNFHDDVRRARELSAKGVHYVDAGTSGGIWGLTEGYCLMVGGEEAICRALEPVFLTLAPEHGYLRVGDHGAGPLREDGAQRDRVRADAVVRRGLSSDARRRLPDRPGRRRGSVDARQRRSIVAARAGGACAARGTDAWTA